MNNSSLSPSVISTFSGCGGSSLGYKMAGYRVLMANEFVPAARETYEANFPDTIMLADDIRKLRGAEMLERVGLERGELDTLDGSPPCSSFSMAGSRSKGWGKVKPYSDGIDQRVDDLYFEYIRLLYEIRPKTFLTENVPALTEGVARGYFNEILNGMKAKGYRVQAAIVNASWYGVAQNRKRLFFMGVREDLAESWGVEPSFPEPIYHQERPPRTVGDALSTVDNQLWELKEARDVPPNILEWLRVTPTGSQASKVHPRHSYYSLVRLGLTKPAPTITNISYDSRTNEKRAAQCHPIENRYLTISELKAICSFPPDFILTGNFCQQWERLSRAVPPLLMKAMAGHLKEQILSKINIEI